MLLDKVMFFFEVNLKFQYDSCISVRILSVENLQELFKRN